MDNKRILVVDDERDIVRIVQYHLKKNGFRVTPAYSGGQALDAIDSGQKFDLIILDILMPGMDGMEICRRLKDDPKTRDIPVIMLTVKSEESEIIAGFTQGAEDYITKPFSPKILMERVKVILRRKSSSPFEQGEEVLTLGKIEIDIPKFRVRVSGKNIDLTKLEFNILVMLVRSPGRVFSRSEIIRSSWPGDSISSDKVVDVHIAWLRQKLGPSGRFIETVRGAGYRCIEGA